MKITRSVVHLGVMTAALGVGACGSSHNGAAAAGAASTAGSPPSAKVIDATSALSQMQSVVSADRGATAAAQKVNVADLPKQLRTRLSNAQLALQQVTTPLSDQGDANSAIYYVLTAQSATDFIGFAVSADAADDSGNYSAAAVAYYSPTGSLLDVETRASGLSDREDLGGDGKTDPTVIAQEDAALKAAYTFTASPPFVNFIAPSENDTDINSLPFAALVNAVKSEIDATTLAHVGNGPSYTRLVAVNGSDGSLVGYVLASAGADLASQWNASGVAAFSASGELLERQISSAGLADDMNDDSLAPAH